MANVSICNGDSDYSFAQFITQHASQLETSGIPQSLWATLYTKLVHQIYDAGSVFQLNQVVSEEDEDTIGWSAIVLPDKKVSVDDPASIYLIDHAWTFEWGGARKQLEMVPGLLQRMSTLMDCPDDEDNKLDFVMNRLWNYVGWYSTREASVTEGPEAMAARSLLWYVLDEFGARLEHSDSPTCRMTPLIFVPSGEAYSVLWPIRDLNSGDEVSRDCVNGCSDKDLRQLRLLPWFPDNLDAVLEKGSQFVAPVTDVEYFSSHRMMETLPVEKESLDPPKLPRDRKLRVFTEWSAVDFGLRNSDTFELIDEAADADILWLSSNFKDFEGLSTNSEMRDVFVNQFPMEVVLTVKDLLAALAMEPVDGEVANWYPETYNLSRGAADLCRFVAAFHRRDGNSATKNVWILKPWNLARGLGIVITENLNQIIRVSETGPMIASRYLTDPILFYRPDLSAKVKFDIRYMVLLNSVRPLKLYAYNVFWLRFANQAFELHDWENYDIHFTVQNYRIDSKLYQLNCEDFVPQWNKQYYQWTWHEHVEPMIFKTLRLIFETAQRHLPPRGLASSPQSRAIYAVDMLLEWQLGEPSVQVCEVNFGPDCKRAVKYHPNFFEDIFATLFLDQPRNCVEL